ncbi:uncharacterized protein LOC122617497 isoform X1 [Drosophila teissieri]|uniref:uncharacterized protein LOC122617497 isoform X1 n=1 Tax=Drosophila teissieri TaxID=7243 RepID=UPI001CBA0BC3|nr:uncharacterized protein LOC122617497 isoform X1 [Drosophila teissieri]
MTTMVSPMRTIGLKTICGAPIRRLSGQSDQANCRRKYGFRSYELRLTAQRDWFCDATKSADSSSACCSKCTNTINRNITFPPPAKRTYTKRANKAMNIFVFRALLALFV